MSVSASYYPFQAHYQPSVPVASVPSVSVGKTLGNYFAKAFDFTGRASLIEFWVPWLVILVPLFAVRVVLWLFFGGFPEWIYAIHSDYGRFVSIEWIVWFILLLPFLSLSIRRMRDSVAPSGLIVIPFILTALSLILLVVEHWYYVEWFSEVNALGFSALLLVEVVLQTGVIQNYGFFEVVLEIVKYGINDMGVWYLMFIVLCALANILLLIFMLLPSRTTNLPANTMDAMNGWGQVPIQAQSYPYGAPVPAVPSGVRQAVSPDVVDPVLAELNDNQTSVLRLREIASQATNNPQYRDRLLAHPNMYPELAQWLRSLP